MLKKLRSLPNFKILSKRLERKISSELGLYTIKYRPYFKNFDLFRKFLNEKETTLLTIKNKINNLIISVPQNKEKIKEEFPVNYEGIIDKANDIVNNRFDVFERTFQFDRRINWSFSEMGASWPKIHFPKIKIDSKVFGDIKYPWKLNRLGILQVLALTFYLTNDKG